MNIVLIAPFALEPKGTVSARMVPLAKSLISLGHTATIVVPPWDYPDHAGKTFSKNTVPIVNVKLPPSIPLLWYLLLTLDLIKTALSLKPQTVYCFKPKGFSGMAAILLSVLKFLKLTNVKIAVDSDDWEGQDGWNDVLPYPWWQKKVFSCQEEWLLRNAEVITLASKKLIEMAYSVRNAKDSVFYLPNGIEATGLTQEVRERSRVRAIYGINETPIVLLYTRYVEFQPERVVGIMRQAESLGACYVLLVVGEGPADEGEQLGRLWQENGLRSRLVRAGWVQVEEIKDYIFAADVAIYPMDDNMINQTKCPVKLVELLGAGVPVVAEAVGQVKEYITHNRSGILIEPGDEVWFGQMVARLLRSPEERDRLGRGAIKEIEDRFLWSSLAVTAEEALRA